MNNIEKTLVLNNEHIKETTIRSLEKNEGGAPFRTASHHHGIIIFMFDHDMHEELNEECESLKESNMEELIPILFIARTENCTTIMFDSDGSINDNLQTFVW